ncbi:GAF domain-containing protein [Thermodesulfobacteriota bacterium]
MEKPDRNELLDKINQLEIDNKNLKQNEVRLESLLSLSQLTDVSEREIREYALESVVSLTNSKAGYLHFVDEDQEKIDLVSWSKGALELCTAEKTAHYPIDQAGIWADSVRLRIPVVHNDYQNITDKKGYPEGHFHVARHLSVPIFDSEKIVAVAGVGNKEIPYDNSDLRQTQLFMNSMWAILKQKKALQEIRALRGILPLCSFCKKIRDDEGYWEQVDIYIRKHSKADISHSICPECMEKHYGK